MLIRISLIVAILASIGVAVLNFTKIKDQITTLVDDRDAQRKEKEAKTHALTETNKVLKATSTELAKTKTDLASATDERDKAVAEAADVKNQLQTTSATLAKTKEDLATAKNNLAQWDNLGVRIEVIKTTLASIKNLKAERDNLITENGILMKANQKLTNQIQSILDPENFVVALPPGLHGSVAVADPKFDFVVLNLGEKDGVQPNGQMLVNHGGKLVAKVRIKSVQNNQCIANIMPGWKLSDVMEGDTVLVY